MVQVGSIVVTLPQKNKWVSGSDTQGGTWYTAKTGQYEVSSSFNLTYGNKRFKNRC